MKNKDIVPLIISIILMLVSFGKVLTSNHILNQSHYIGIGCLIISTLLYFSNKKVYIYFFGLTLIAGLIGLLDFFYATFKIGVGDVGVNPVFIALLILFFAFDKDVMNVLFPEKPIKKG